MTQSTPLDGVTRWVRRVIEQGIRLDPSLVDHLEATFGSTDLSKALDDPTSSEAASFLELLFFPDESIRLEFERRWGDHAFSEREVAHLIQSLDREGLTAAIQDSDGAPVLRVKVPDFAIASFVKRLNLTWAPPPPLLEMVSKSVPADELVAVRTRLRRLRLAWHAVQIDLVERFLTRFPAMESDHGACFEFLSTLLADVGRSDDPFSFLVAKKHFFFQALCKAERFERLRQTSNMETLMLQGARAAHGSAAEWREQMRLIDRLCQSLYGKTRFFRQPDELTLDQTYGSADRRIGELVRLLH